MFQLPWSNFHELNLDWIMSKIKELDDKIIGSSTPSTTPPEMDGVASPGFADSFSRGDHRHPTDTSRASASGLTQEISDRSDADLSLSGRIDTLDARVVPSDAYPLMDGTAESGSHVQYSRRDHRHPTDTSRAAQTDLQAEINDRINDVHTLQGDINAVDAKINLSSAAPLMDSSSASSGSSTQMARADHVHPTDTSRASATDVATLQARMDAFAGSANPSDTTPVMDGVGTAGSGGNYSRGDHQHPSDTSKLDVAGGTVTGDLTIQGHLTEDERAQFITVNAIGWIRAIQAPLVYGTAIDIVVARKGTVAPSEVHKVTYIYNQSGPSFVDEQSTGDVLYIDKIRITNAGRIDIHMDQSAESQIGVYINGLAPTSQDTENIKTLALAGVADAPAGETILLTHTFGTNYPENASSYTKLPDGTMIQWGTISGLAFDNTVTLSGTETFPVPFINTSYLVVPAAVTTGLNQYLFRVGANANTTGIFSWILGSGDSSAITTTGRGFNWIAIGKWK